MIHDRPAIGDQALQPSSGSIVRRPYFERGVMSGQQFGQIKGILSVALGPAGDEGFSKLLQGDGIDGIESDKLKTLQEDNEVVGRLLQTDGNPLAGVLALQLSDPVLKGFGMGGDAL